MAPHKYFDEFRRRWQNPETILTHIGLKPGQTLVDVGCGNGFFAVPATRIVGEGGKVYGLDIDASAIDELRERARREGLSNLVLTVGRAEETVLCDACADVVLMANDLHDFQDPKKALGSARRMVKPSGRLADVDWKKKQATIVPGPPLRVRLSEKEASDLIEASGFEIEAAEEAGPYHYLILAKPKIG